MKIEALPTDIAADDVTPWPDWPSYREGLQDLPSAFSQALRDAGTVRRWRKGQAILRQGQQIDAIVIHVEGRVAAMLATPSGHDTLLRWLTQGELVGMPAVLAGAPCSTSIIANSAAVTRHVDRQTFLRIMNEQPAGAISMSILLSHRLCELFRYVEMTAYRSLDERVRYALIRLARLHGTPAGRHTVALKITQSELAAASGASRQRVHQRLKALQSRGAISLGYGHILIQTNKL